jgi:ABC-type Fe3+/spermidine/putrescine transport system ATPase subunit
MTSGLKIRGLRATLGGFTLGPVDLDADPGEIVAVVGPSGAGKTTLLRAIAGFVPRTQGSIHVGEHELSGRPPERRGTGYVPQGLALLPHRSVLRNVRFGLDLRGRRDADEVARGWLEKFGLLPLASVRPSRLSGGEQQRVAMARALAVQPGLLLWDEPVSALDVEARGALLDVLRTALRELDSPMLLVTHDPETAFALADRFLILRAGVVAFWGRAQSLVEHPRDAFTARFAGYANVVDSSELQRESPSPFVDWLRQRSGPQGICWTVDSMEAVPDPAADGWALEVRRVQPSPEGWRVGGSVEGLMVWARLRRAEGGTEAPHLPSTVKVTVDESGLRPCGGVEGS